MREQDQDLLIVPVDSEFDGYTHEQRQASLRELQRHAEAAMLTGTVIVVWQSGESMAFVAPRRWHPLLAGLDLKRIAARTNKELFW